MTLPSKELLSEVLDYQVNDYGFDAHDKNLMFLNQTYWIDYDGVKHRSGCKKAINIYELAHLNLKQWAKLKNVFDMIDWSEEPEKIFAKAEELRNEIS